MIPALYRDWNDELRRNVGGFPCPAPTLTHRACHFPALFAASVPPERGLVAGPCSANGYRYALLRLTCGDPADLLDQQQIAIPVPGAAPIQLEVHRTAGYVPTAGWTEVNLTAAATSVDIATAIAAVLDVAPQITSGRIRRFDSAAGTSSIDLVARDPFVANRTGCTITAGTPVAQALRFGAGADHRDPWKVIRTGGHPHRRWVRCLVQSERDAIEGQPQ